MLFRQISFHQHIFRVRSATVIQAVYLFEKFSSHRKYLSSHILAIILMSYFCKKKNNICMCQSLSSFVPSAFNFKFMIHAKPFQVKLTITIFDRCQRELFITNIQLSVRTICKFDQTRLQIEMRKLALQVTFSPKPLTVKSHGQFSFFVARYILF